MKKTLLVSAATLALLLGAALAPQTVHAADADKPATGDSYAEFQVTAGDGSTTPGGNTGTGANAGLVLAQVPDLNFGSTNVAALIKGATLKYVDGKIVKTGTGVADQNGIIEVKDYRGTNAGWTLSAQLGDMKNASSTSLAGTLALKATADQVDVPLEDGTTLGGSLVTNGAVAPVWSASANHGEGDNQAKVSTDTTFTTVKNSQATTGQYDADMTWTLANVPATD